MDMVGVKYQNNLSYFTEKIPQKIYQDLFESTKQRRKEQIWNMNNRLAGALNQQSSLNSWSFDFENYILSCARFLWKDVYKTCPWDFDFIKDPKFFYKLKKLWVNYQQKNEYNPLHDHSGIISFVIFIDIPYGSEERNIHSSNGTFQLENEVLPVDKSWNGVILMFPSTTKHAVYPYNSTDKERITVSGNITWNVDDVGEEHY